MSVSVFPVPTSGGGGGGGSNLPEGAVSQVVQGRLSLTGYDFPDTLAAGKYLINCNGNVVELSLGDLGQTVQIATSATVTLPSQETNASLSLAASFGGPSAEIQGILPAPVIGGYSSSYVKNVDFSIDPVSGAMALTRGLSSNTTSTETAFRAANGALTGTYLLTVRDIEYTATAINGNDFYVAFNNGTGNDHRLLKYSVSEGTFTYPLLNDTFFTSTNGVSGLAISDDGQTIVITALAGEAKALTSIDGGTTWTQVTLPAPVRTGADIFGKRTTYTNGYFFVPTSTNGGFMTSTDGLSWSIYGIGGASAPVTGFAYDGSVFLLACGGTNVIYRATTLGSFSAIALTGAMSNGAVNNVAYGNGKFAVCSNLANSNQGHWWISEDAGLTFFIIDPSNDDLTYGNKQNYWNASIFGATTVGISQSNKLIFKMEYDPLYKTFASVMYDMSTNANGRPEPLNVDSTNYYKWAYSHARSTPPTTYNQISWSAFTNRWYYSHGNDQWGMTLMFSYDPVTQNVRTEPIARTLDYAMDIASDVSGDHYNTLMTANGHQYNLTERGTTLQMCKRVLTDPDVFWTDLVQTDNVSVQQPTHYGINFPDGSAAFLSNNSTSNSSYIKSKFIGADGIVYHEVWPGNTNTNTSIIAFGNVSYDTDASTFGWTGGNTVTKGVPYPIPAVDQFFTGYSRTLRTGTTFYTEIDGEEILYDSSDQTVRITTNGGLSYKTYPSCSSIQKIWKRNGTYYILTGKSVLSIDDWATEDYKLISEIPTTSVAYELWDNMVQYPNNTVADPLVMENNGRITKLFTETEVKNEADVFVYDMNLQEL
jgi:hypothetical protein